MHNRSMEGNSECTVNQRSSTRILEKLSKEVSLRGEHRIRRSYVLSGKGAEYTGIIPKGAGRLSPCHQQFIQKSSHHSRRPRPSLRVPFGILILPLRAFILNPSLLQRVRSARTNAFPNAFARNCLAKREAPVYILFYTIQEFLRDVK